VLEAGVGGRFAKSAPLTPSVEVTNIPAFALVLCVLSQLFQVMAADAATGSTVGKFAVVRGRFPGGAGKASGATAGAVTHSRSTIRTDTAWCPP
jgi:hypothetical protein